MKQKANVGLVFLLMFVIVILLGPFFVPMDPDFVDLSQKLQVPSSEHWFGTDQLGRDQLSRILAGGQITVGISLMALVVAVMIGVPIGLFAGYYGGWLDWFLMRIVDAFIAFPEYIIVIIISGLLGPGIVNLLLAVLVVKWVNYARLTRSIVVEEKTKDYLLVAKISGANGLQTIMRHLVPHIIKPVFALVTLDFGKVILVVASLSYVGLGVQPPTAEWGAMLNEGKDYYSKASYLMFVPGLAIFLTVFITNLVGNKYVEKYK